MMVVVVLGSACFLCAALTVLFRHRRKRRLVELEDRVRKSEAMVGIDMWAKAASEGQDGDALGLIAFVAGLMEHMANNASAHNTGSAGGVSAQDTEREQEKEKEKERSDYLSLSAAHARLVSLRAHPLPSVGVVNKPVLMRMDLHTLQYLADGSDACYHGLQLAQKYCTAQASIDVPLDEEIGSPKGGDNAG